VVRIFLSHSSQDDEFAARLASDLKAAGFAPWLDDDEVFVGDSIVSSVSRALDSSDFVVVICSKTAVASGWVEREWAVRYSEEVKKHYVRVLPQLIEDCELPALLRDRSYADFRQNHSAGLNELIRVIREHMRRRVSRSMALLAEDKYLEEMYLLDALNGNLFLTEDLAEFIANTRDPVECSILLIDVDNLTIINRHYSKQVGDAVLSAVLEVLWRRDDIRQFGRSGDGTFYYVMRWCDEDETGHIANDIRQSVSAFEWKLIASTLRVTCSMGIAMYRPGEPSIDFVVRAALGLVRAKEYGPNSISQGPLHLKERESRWLRDYFS